VYVERLRTIHDNEATGNHNYAGLFSPSEQRKGV